MKLDVKSEEYLTALLKIKVAVDQYNDNIRRLNFDIDRIEINVISDLRKEAESNGGIFILNGVKTKLTETALGKMPFKYNSSWQKKKMDVIDNQYHLSFYSSLYSILEKRFNTIYKRTED